MNKIEKFFEEKTKDSSLNLALSKSKKRNGYKILLGMLIIASISVSGYFYYQYRNIKNNPDIVAQEENSSLLEKVGKIMDLPQNETPTIATVSDKDKLKDQDFFKNSENGDKILIYANYKMAILYRPDVNKIMKVAPLVMDQNDSKQGATENNNSTSQIQTPTNQNSQNSNSSPSEPSDAIISKDIKSDDLRIIINNGTTTIGLTKELQEKLNGTTGINISNTGNAAKNDYTKTLIIDLTHKNTDLINQIAQAIGGEIASLPDGEMAPEDADVLIIAGK